MKKVSEEEKDYYRKVFEERTGVVEYAYGWGWVPIKTKEELEKLLNTDNIRPYANEPAEVKPFKVVLRDNVPVIRQYDKELERRVEKLEKELK